MPMTTIDIIIEQASSYLPQLDVELIRQAGRFSARAHEKRPVVSGLDSVRHALDVASILTRLKVDETTLVVGLLHDVLESGTVAADDLSSSFGKSVASLVEISSKISSITVKVISNRSKVSAKCLFPWRGICG